MRELSGCVEVIDSYVHMDGFVCEENGVNKCDVSAMSFIVTKVNIRTASKE